MGNTDSLPVVSQTKSLVQAVTGDTEGARKTQQNFLETGIIFSQITSLVQSLNGDNEAARNTQIKFCENLEGVCDSLPVVGHIKGGIHYILGQNERGHLAMKSASGSVVLIIAATGGTIAGGPAGGAAASLAASKGYEVMITAIDTTLNGRREDGRFRYYGSLNAVDNILRFESSSGEVFDLIVETAYTTVSGASVGKVGKGFRNFAKSVGSEIIKLNPGKKVVKPIISYKKGPSIGKTDPNKAKNGKSD